MSHGPRPGEQAGIYPIERIITVPLPGVPAARAAYSSNPGFTDGVEEAHPISSGELSMFAEPQIVEALEAVHLYSSNGTGEFHLEAIDPETALGGLRWLRKNMASDSEVRRHAIDTRDSVEAALSHQAARHEHAAAQAAEPDPEQVAKAEAKARKQRHEAEVEKQLDGVFTGALEMIDGVDISTVVELTGMLVSKEDDGGIVIRDNKTFLKALHDRVGAYMDEPKELLKDFKALIACNAFIKHRSEAGNEDGGGEDYGIAQGYLDHMEIGLLQILARTAYVDLSEEIMGVWFDALADEPDEPIYEGAYSSWTEVSQEIMAKTQVLANSLAMAAKKDPYAYIDTLYAFADKGLDPEDSPRLKMTASTIAICLTNDLACIELNQAALAAQEGSAVQRKAMDIRLSLAAVGLSGEQIAGNQDIKKLTKEEINMVCALYPLGSLTTLMGRRAMLGPANADSTGDIMLSDEAADRFRAQAMTTDGKTSTILGRLSSFSDGLNLPRG